MSDRKEKTFVRFREWLTPDDLSVNSSMSGVVSIATWVDKSGDSEFRISASLTLTDCARSIDWSFDAYNSRDEVDDAFLKLRRIEELLSRFRTALEKARRAAGVPK